MSDMPEKIDARESCGDDGIWSCVWREASEWSRPDSTYVRSDIVDARIDELCAVLRFGVDLIDGDSTGAEWKRGCIDFLRMARAALKQKATKP